MNKERLPWIDRTKGFAALCVVLGHIALGYLEANTFPAFDPIINRIYNAIYAFHMPLFFMISGMLFRRAYVSPGNAGKTEINRTKCGKQILNLIILYVIYSLILGALKIVFADSVNKAVKPSDLLMIWAKPIQLYWYLYVLIIFYMVFAIAINKQTPWQILLIVTGLLSICSGFIPSIKWFECSRILFNGFFFCLGVFGETIEKIKGFLKIKTTFILLAVPVFIYSLITGIKMHSIPILNTFIATGLSLLFIDLFKIPRKGRVGLLQVIGKYSLEIYLLHTYIATALRTVLPRIGITNWIISFLISFVLSTIIPIMIGYISKKLKMHGLLFKPAYFLFRNSFQKGNQG